MKKMFPDWYFCFYKHVSACFIWPCWSKQAFWDRGWKKEFFQADLFVQKAGNKIVIDIALAMSIFRNSFRVRLINIALIAEACQKRVWLLSGDSSSSIPIVTCNLSDSLKSPRPPSWHIFRSSLLSGWNVCNLLMFERQMQ